MATKPDLKGNYLLAEHASLHRNAITSDDVTRLWQTKRSDSGSDQSGLVGAFVSQTRQKLGLLAALESRREGHEGLLGQELRQPRTEALYLRLKIVIEHIADHGHAVPHPLPATP